MAPSPNLVYVFEHDDTRLHRHAEERQHADARRDAKVSSGKQESQQAADPSHPDVQKNEQRPFERAEHRVENYEDDENRQWDDNSQSCFSPLLTLVFARPLDAI